MDQFVLFVTTHWLLVAAFLIILILFIANELTGYFSGVKQLASPEVVHAINRENAVVIDIRDVAAFKTGHIVDAINIPRETLESSKQKLEKHKDRLLIICCPTGQNSTKAASTLRAEGFTKIAILKGGLAAWRSANLPVVKK